MNLTSNIRKINIGLLLLFFIHLNSFAQSPYEIKSNLDFGLIGFGALTLTSGQVLANNTSILTVSEINAFNPNQVNSFDRFATSNYSSSAKTVSDVLAFSTVAASACLILDKKIRQDWVTIGVMGVEVLMVTYGLTSTSKNAVLRARPYVYNPTVPVEVKQDVDARYSFFSGHTALTTSVSFFAAKVYADTHPNSKWKPVMWSAAIVIPAITGWARVEAGQHFPTDIITGYVVGAAIGFLVPQFHLKKDSSRASFQLQPSVEGLAFRMVF
jgi:membrane-associated phospholipid phosphatase